MQSTRVARVQRELYETCSQFLQHRLGEPLPCYAAVSAVDVSPDLRNARVFFRLVGGDPEVAEAKVVLGRERAQFQKHVARSLKMKFCPVLRFEYGVAPHHDPIDELFENLHKPKFYEG